MAYRATMGSTENINQTCAVTECSNICIFKLISSLFVCVISDLVPSDLDSCYD